MFFRFVRRLGVLDSSEVRLYWRAIHSTHYRSSLHTDPRTSYSLHSLLQGDHDSERRGRGGQGGQGGQGGRTGRGERGEWEGERTRRGEGGRRTRMGSPELTSRTPAIDWRPGTGLATARSHTSLRSSRQEGRPSSSASSPVGFSGLPMNKLDFLGMEPMSNSIGAQGNGSSGGGAGHGAGSGTARSRTAGSRGGGDGGGGGGGRRQGKLPCSHFVAGSLGPSQDEPRQAIVPVSTVNELNGEGRFHYLTDK